VIENEPTIPPVEPAPGDFTDSHLTAPQESTPRALEGYPFWGYMDLAVFVMFALCVFGAISLVLWVLHPNVSRPAFVLLPAQCLIYAFLFLALYAILKRHYGQPFWRSLRWVRTRPGVPRTILYGFVLAFGIMLLGTALHTPDVQTPMKALLSDRSSLLLVGIFAVTLGPLAEELVFRGFLQPVLARSLGPVAGLVLTAILFGLLHLSEYGGSWRHGLLITVAGAGFGWMRQASGSTRAAAIMHGSYNFIFFAAMFAQKGMIPHAW
jgi:membrane protease YdiL (CAAX protease family)